VIYTIEYTDNGGSSYYSIGGIFAANLIGSDIFISVLSTSQSEAKLYSLRVTSELSTHASITNYYEIDIEVVDPCMTTAITVPILDDVVYYIYGNDLIITFDSFTSSVLNCGTFSYNVYVNYEDDALDPGYITYDSSTMTITVATSDISFIGTYTVFIKGSLPIPYSNSISSFNLEIKCTDTIIY
jgi:hypothetical protein